MKKRVLIISSICAVTAGVLAVLASKKSDSKDNVTVGDNIDINEMTELFTNPRDVYNVVSAKLWSSMCEYMDAIVRDIGKQRILSYSDGVLTTESIKEGTEYRFFENGAELRWEKVR